LTLLAQLTLVLLTHKANELFQPLIKQGQRTTIPSSGRENLTERRVDLL
jgi:hypothetical protein